MTSLKHVRDGHDSSSPCLVRVIVSGSNRGATKGHHEILVLVHNFLGELVFVAVPVIAEVTCSRIQHAMSSPDVLADVHESVEHHEAAGFGRGHLVAVFDQ